MKKLSAKFHLSLGLTSIVMTLLLSATILNLIPDRTQSVLNGRVALAESIASSSTLFLSKEDYAGITSNLEFLMSRNEDLQAAIISRGEEDEPLKIGDESAIGSDFDDSKSTPSTLVLPILQGDTEWGKISLFFSNVEGDTRLQKIQTEYAPPSTHSPKH